MHVQDKMFGSIFHCFWFCQQFGVLIYNGARLICTFRMLNAKSSWTHLLLLPCNSTPTPQHTSKYPPHTSEGKCGYNVEHFLGCFCDQMGFCHREHDWYHVGIDKIDFFYAILGCFYGVVCCVYIVIWYEDCLVLVFTCL